MLNDQRTLQQLEDLCFLTFLFNMSIWAFDDIKIYNWEWVQEFGKIKRCNMPLDIVVVGIGVHELKRGMLLNVLMYLFFVWVWMLSLVGLSLKSLIHLAQKMTQAGSPVQCQWSLLLLHIIVNCYIEIFLSSENTNQITM